MSFELGYALVVGPLVVLALAGVWVPRPWQAVAVLAAPTLIVLAVLGVAGLDRLGWLLVLGLPYVSLVMLPLVPWPRTWVRTAMPLHVLVVVAAVLALNRIDAGLVFFIAWPAASAIGGLVVGAVLRRRDAPRVRRERRSP